MEHREPSPVHICAKEFESKMKKTVVLLEYTDETNDILVLGVFSLSKLDEIISFYKTLNGFRDVTGSFVFDKYLSVEEDYVYLLQIYNEHDDSVVYNNIYVTEENAKKYLEYFFNTNDKSDYNSYIERYVIDEKLWTEGFIRK